MIGDRDGAQAPGPSLGQQHLDGCRAVIGVVGVHVQIDIDQPPARQRGAQAVVGPGVVAAGDEARVDLLELAGHTRPGKGVVQLANLRAAALAQLGFGDQTRQLGGKRLHLARLEGEAVTPLGEQFHVDAQPGGDGHDTGGQRRHERARLGAHALRGEHEHVGVGQRLHLADPLAVDELDALAQPGTERAGHRERARGPNGGRPGRLPGQPAQRAQEQPQRSPLLARVEEQAHGAVPLDARLAVGSGCDHPVLAREEALEQVAGRPVARRARVQAAEQQP